MRRTTHDMNLKIKGTAGKCPIGETVGQSGIARSKIPVLSCEGACIRGEIARQAANIIAKKAPYGRGCHGELITVPDSSIALWIKTAHKVVLIDGCFLRCHGRILEKLPSTETSSRSSTPCPCIRSTMTSSTLTRSQKPNAWRLLVRSPTMF